MRYEVRHLLVGAVVFAVGIMVSRHVAAQESAVPAQQAVVSGPGRKQLEDYVRVMNGEVERAEARVTGVREQLMSMDNGIESRVCVTQALDAAASLTQHEEGAVSKYTDRDTNYSIKTREYKHAENDARESAKIKADFVADLRAGIDKLAREKKVLEAEFRQTTDAGKVEQLKKDIDDRNKTIKARRTQIEELVTASEPTTKPVSQRAAFEMDKMIDEMTTELKKDFTAFKRLVAELDAARVRVKPLKERLAKVTVTLATMGSAPAEAGGN